MNKTQRKQLERDIRAFEAARKRLDLKRSRKLYMTLSKRIHRLRALLEG